MEDQTKAMGAKKLPAMLLLLACWPIIHAPTWKVRIDTQGTSVWMARELEESQLRFLIDP